MTTATLSPAVALRLPALPQPRLSRPSLVTGVSLLLAAVASVWSYRTGSMTLYGDARAHLDVARHVTDGLRPGPTQLGSVWLPLPHILLVPFVAISGLWHSALAGALVGGLAFVYSTTRLFALLEELTGSRRAAWCALLAYATNLNVLYLQTTALTEPLLLGFFIGGALHLARWMRTQSTRELAWASLFVMAATMSRYEGWAVLLAASALVLAWSWHRKMGRARVEANVVFFVAASSYGIVLWLLYNLIIFKDPLYFVHSSFSAQSQQVALSSSGQLATKGSVSQSFLTYAWTVVDDLSPVLVIAGIAAGLAAVTLRGADRLRWAAILLLLATPAAFNVVALWLGQSTIRVPQIAPYGMWNDRYGVMAAPAVAVALGLLAARLTFAWLPVAGAVLAGFLTIATSSPLTIRDGRVGTSSAATGRPEEAAAFLGHSYAGGRILADDASAAPLMFKSGLNLSEFVTIGFHPFYENALVAPGSQVAWVVAFSGDAISTDMATYPDRFKDFSLVLRDGRTSLYERLR